MREDMFKVIVERPRWGGRYATKTRLRFDRCVDRSHVTGRRLALEGGGSKQLNENLAPLKRYLHKQVGRRWNEVFSEICEHLDTGSTVKMHVREHLGDFVNRQVYRGVDGYLWSAHRWGGDTKLVDHWVELYVDPDDGIIKQTRELCVKHGVPFSSNRRMRGRSVRNTKEGRVLKIDAMNLYVQLNGIWYIVQLSKPPYGKDGSPLSETSLFEELHENRWCEHERWTVVLKQQLSCKQLRRHGLTNECNDMEVCHG